VVSTDLWRVQVGQQQPKIPVPAPATVSCREIEDGRIVAWVHRMLRKKQNKLARSASDDASEGRPSVNISVCLLSAACCQNI
jgi:hypothetical protein